MSTWLQEVASSHRLQLGITAIVSGCIAASAVIGLQEARRRYNIYDLKESIPDSNTPHDVEKVGKRTLVLQLSLNDNRPDKRLRRGIV